MTTAPTYGIWIASSSEEADARAQAGSPPSIIVYTDGVTTGSDAIRISNTLYPGTSFVREVSTRAKGTP